MDDPAGDLSKRVVAAAKKVRVLGSLSWPEESVQRFLQSWRSGSPRLPKVEPRGVDLGPSIEELDAVGRAADRADPLQDFCARTARSYADAGRMLTAAGSAEFTRLSRRIYGAPDDLLPGSNVSHRSAAEQLLTSTSALAAAGVVPETAYCLTAETVRERLTEHFAVFFGDAAPRVVIDPGLASKAAAGAKRIRLRAGTCFSELDIAQLTQHEGLVHSATALNGRSQPILRCLGLSAPRTTHTQEGLATLAELSTRAIDIARLRRIALRTLGIHHAMNGADYIEVFRFFLEAGQSETESAHSAMRIFRGGDVRGRVVFTKDVVYLGGLLEVHTFMRKAIEAQAPMLVRRLFAGRLTLSDVLRLEPAFANGRIVEGRFTPPWALELHRLAAYLAFSLVVEHIDLGAVSLSARGAAELAPAEA